MRAWVIGILLLLAGFILVVALWLLGYHLTGKWAFDNWKAERVAMGDRFGWKSLRPPVVPQNENFAEAALIRGAILDKSQVSPGLKALELPNNVGEKLGDWSEGRRDDLAAISIAYGAKDLNSIFMPMEAAIQELDQASRRTGNCFPIDYEECQVPALVGFRGAVRTLRVRALTNLRSGRPDQALEDVQTCFRIAGHLKTEPHLISALLRAAVIQISMQVVWEGLEDHLWSEAQLEKIQDSISELNLLATLKQAWQAERQNLIETFSATAENRPVPKFMTSPEDKHVKLGALGRGWFYRNMLVWCEFMSSLIDTQDPAAHRVFPNKLIDPDSWLKDLRFRKDLIMAQIAVPALTTDLATRFARRQALLDEAVVVCALERYRLQKGQYPDRLEDLTPRVLHSLPHDLVSGNPLHYRRQGANFTLYEVGWDGKDDGGKITWTTEGNKRQIENAKGDWVWPHLEH